MNGFGKRVLGGDTSDVRTEEDSDFHGYVGIGDHEDWKALKSGIHEWCLLVTGLCGHVIVPLITKQFFSIFHLRGHGR